MTVERKGVGTIFIDASNWQALPWFSSGGTRAKRVLQDENNKLWYFKCSERKEARDGKPEKYYKYEFWSEVIAYQIGNALGLDILRYDVALHDGEIGCISPLMIDQEKEQLVEVGRFMTAINPGFNPEDRKTHKEYTFDFLIETLEHFKLDDYLDRFLKILLFDALIGNTDRHQENWAFITRSTFISGALDVVEEAAKNHGYKKLPGFIRFFYKWLFDPDKNELNNDGKLIKLKTQAVLKLAPIYDSGSSLGRELDEEKIGNFLQDENQLIKYIEYGRSELHWEGKKVSHFDFLKGLLTTAYIETVEASGTFIDSFNEATAFNIVNQIDNTVPEEFKDWCLTDNRKQFILKLLTLRSQKLKAILKDGRV